MYNEPERRATTTSLSLRVQCFNGIYIYALKDYFTSLVLKGCGYRLYVAKKKRMAV